MYANSFKVIYARPCKLGDAHREIPYFVMDGKFCDSCYHTIPASILQYHVYRMVQKVRSNRVEAGT